MGRREQITMKFKGEDDLAYFEELRRGAVAKGIPIGKHALNVLKRLMSPDDVDEDEEEQGDLSYKMVPSQDFGWPKEFGKK